MSRLPATPFEEFDALAALFGRTRVVLDTIHRRGSTDRSSSDVLADETLPYIEGVEAGFRARLRTSDTDLAVLRALVSRGGLRLPEPEGMAEERAALIEAMQALSGAGGPRDVISAPGRELTALEHARIAMALLPRTPASAVHYPGPNSYADIAPPATPAEFVARIEEVERTLWRAASGRLARPNGSTWRRVYAFFDAGERLSTDGLMGA